jgi:hypothetical protein
MDPLRYAFEIMGSRRWVRVGCAGAFLGYLLGGPLCAGCSELNGHCSKDSQCPDWQRCDRTCVTPCDTHESCPFGQYCDDHSPSNDFPQCRRGCRANEECTAGSFCSEGQCVPGCRDDSECTDNWICESGTCRSGCRSDDDCPGEGWCRYTTCNSGCRSHDECAEGTACVYTAEALWACRPYCRECAEGTACAQSGDGVWSCVPECFDDSDCAGGRCVLLVPSLMFFSPRICEGEALRDGGADASFGDGGPALEASTTD